jgi:hypothetical protein
MAVASPPYNPTKILKTSFLNMIVPSAERSLGNFRGEVASPDAVHKTVTVVAESNQVLL